VLFKFSPPFIFQLIVLCFRSELAIPIFNSALSIFSIKSIYYKLGTAVALCELIGTLVVLWDGPGQVSISVQQMFLPPAWNHHCNQDFEMQENKP